MSRITFFHEILANVFDQRKIFKSARDDRDMLELCHALLSEKGEVSGAKLAAALLANYSNLEVSEKIDFFASLGEQFDIEPETVIDAANLYLQNRSPENLSSLVGVAEPRRLELLRRLNQVPGATEQLVRMREDLLSSVRESHELARVDADFEHLFSSWFNRGFLVLKPIDWKTPANILEKIIEYEAVHAINDWDDLRRRLEPEDRRCFAFFHPAMPEEPLIFVEVALTSGIPASIDEVLAETREHVGENVANTAVFYSISNCQKGLKGVSFGNFLIKQVVSDLARDLPNIKNFVTLSPIPGFVRWFKDEFAQSENATIEKIRSFLSDTHDNPNAEELAEYEKPLKALAARYFLSEKQAGGKPVDPVARFHLGNGASLMKINWMADGSEKGRAQSGGMMVNYLYDPDTIEANHEAYAQNYKIKTTREIQALLKVDPEKLVLQEA